MHKFWQPSSLGLIFTSAKPWKLTFSANQYLLQTENIKQKGEVTSLEELHIKAGLFWSKITFPVEDGKTINIRGIPNDSAEDLKQAIANTVQKIKIENAIKNFDSLCQPIVDWTSSTLQSSKNQLIKKGWLTHEFKSLINSAKPINNFAYFNAPEIVAHLKSKPEEIQNAINLWQKNFFEYADVVNQRHLTNELIKNKSFFDNVEKSLLTEEQAKAVICFDNRVLLVASAGSGKTSTMVAKAGYALKKGYFDADKILLLAFNKDAAKELKERINARLTPLGLPASKIEASTFHAFGLNVIGEATGKRPTVASWIENDKVLEVLLKIIDDLKDQDQTFRTLWDLFRIVFGQDLPQFGKEQEALDSWDRNSNTEGFWTLNGETVKSRGEQVIANWLWYNGVRYQYEPAYKIDTANAHYRQYTPDFYFPDIDVYLEHWAVDQNGNPPPEFIGYKEGMEWKRKLHIEFGTRLIETTMSDLWSGKAFSYLSRELTKFGLVLDPNPDREVTGRRPIENPRLAGTFRTFLTHVKSNRLTMEVLRKQLDEGNLGPFRYRHQIFLDLFERIFMAWEAKLKQDKVIDFEDMLTQAADCIHDGQWQSKYELVMVDEFQDVSQARARLIAGLLKKPGSYLFAVGDDWQSINRYAGSDLNVMTEFESTFGKAITLRLETTFRCPQSLCDISSSFVQKNPYQLSKRVISAKSNVDSPVRIIQVEDSDSIRAAIENRIAEIASLNKNKDKKTRIYVLGRYKKEKEYMPLKVYPGIEVQFVTAHSSKGLEADHVIIPKMTSETLGFPSQIEDDPVLQLAMPNPDKFAFSEERRLFYVALTRSKSTVTLITIKNKESSFITELIKDFQVEVFNLEGQESSSELCPICQKGFLVIRNGRYGFFFGCSTYPKCKHMKRIHDK